MKKQKIIPINMRVQRAAIEEILVLKYNRIAIRLGLSMRNVAYIMNVSTTYLSNILQLRPVSKHSIMLFVMLIDFLNRVDYLKPRQPNEKIGNYHKRKKEKLEKVKKHFLDILDKVSFY
jgi:hypothetical protein